MLEIFESFFNDTIWSKLKSLNQNIDILTWKWCDMF